MTLRIPSTAVPAAAPVAPAAELTRTGNVHAPAAPATRDLFGAPEALSSGVSGRTQVPSAGFFLGNAGDVGNGFQISLSGHYPPVPGGNILEKGKQAAINTDFEVHAQESLVSGGLLPTDSKVRHLLGGLHVTRPLPDAPVSAVTYSSHIPGCSAKSAYDFFVAHPKAVFGAGNLHLRPGAAQLHDGARVMLQDNGPPALWFPIQIHLDPVAKTVHIETLDGHPFRGTNDFHFADDGHGGVKVEQHSEFQGSSDLLYAGLAAGALDKQHAAWKGLHAYLHESLAKS